MFDPLSSSESRRIALPRSAAFGSLALAAVSASCLNGVAATAQAANPAAVPTNGPIACTTYVHVTGSQGGSDNVGVWHDVNPPHSLIPCEDELPWTPR